MLNEIYESQLWSKRPGIHLVTDEQWERICEFAKLSPRESQVTRLLFDGLNRVEISERLGIKFSTVRQYVEQIHTKLRVGTRVALVLRIIMLRDFLN